MPFETLSLKKHCTYLSLLHTCFAFSCACSALPVGHLQLACLPEGKARYHGHAPAAIHIRCNANPSPSPAHALSSGVPAARPTSTSTSTTAPACARAKDPPPSHATAAATPPLLNAGTRLPSDALGGRVAVEVGRLTTAADPTPPRPRTAACRQRCQARSRSRGRRAHCRAERRARGRRASERHQRT